MLSSNEVLALNAILEDAIVKSRDEDDGDPVFHEVNVSGVNPFPDTQTQSDVYTSLATKGLIQCSGTEDSSGNEILEYVCITQTGLDALKFETGVH
jgi:hypothetical protein